MFTEGMEIGFIRVSAKGLNTVDEMVAMFESENITR